MILFETQNTLALRKQHTMAMAVRNAGDLFLQNGELRQGPPPQVLAELREVFLQRNPQAPHLPPRDVEVDQPVPVPEQQVPAPPQSSGWGWKGYSALYVSAMATGGLLGVSLVATGQAVRRVYSWATAPSEENPEVTV